MGSSYFHFAFQSVDPSLRSPLGEPTCKEGVWTQFLESDLMDLKVTPDAQCWRTPPCLRSGTFLSPELCQRWPEDDDWPTWSDAAVVPLGAKRASDILRDFLQDRTIVFVGDSINQLVHQAFLCDIAREDNMPTTDLRQGEPLAARVERYNEVMRREIDWVGGPPRRPIVIGNTNTVIGRKGWHHYGKVDMRAILEMADIVVVNYGLHYPDTPGMPEYADAMREMFEQASAFAKMPGKAFVFRETAAIHRHLYDDAEEAEYDTEDRRLGCRCRTDTDSTQRVKRHNGIIHSLLREFTDIGLAPFYDLTAPLQDHHEGPWCSWPVMKAMLKDAKAIQDFCCDWCGRERRESIPICLCGARDFWRRAPTNTVFGPTIPVGRSVHYCYTPQMWHAFEDGLYKALQRAPGLQGAAATPAAGVSESKQRGGLSWFG